MTDSKLNELNEKYRKLQQDYNQLLEKNQNDLITIRKKQTSINGIIQQHQKEKDQLIAKYTLQINKISLQMEKMKQKISQKKQSDNHIQSINDLLTIKQSRIQQLQITSRKLIDQNINLDSQNHQLRNSVQQLTRQNQQNISTISHVSQQLQKFKQLAIKPPTKSYQLQTQGQFINKQQLLKVNQSLTKMKQEFTQKIESIMANYQASQKKVELIKARLKQTNEELKRVVDKDKRTTILLRKKQQQLLKIQQEIDKTRKPSKMDKRKMQTEQSSGCLKCKQHEQQNRLLKQMVKSVQTMVRVKQIEVERYKNHSNNQSIHSEPKQVKKSSDKFPPLRKHY